MYEELVLDVGFSEANNVSLVDENLDNLVPVSENILNPENIYIYYGYYLLHTILGYAPYLLLYCSTSELVLFSSYLV